MSNTERDCLIEDLAQRIEGWGMTAPAILLAEANRPLAFLGSQVMLLGQPLLSLLGWGEPVGQWARLLEDGSNLERLVQRLEQGSMHSAGERR